MASAVGRRPVRAHPHGAMHEVHAPQLNTTEDTAVPQSGANSDRQTGDVDAETRLALRGIG